MNLKLIPFLFLVSIACLRVPDSETLPDPVGNGDMVISDHFDYSTTQVTNIELRILSNNNTPLPKVPLSMSLYHPENDSSILEYGMTDDAGMFSTSIVLPSFADSIFVKTSYIGIPQLHKIRISSSQRSFTIGGDSPDPGVIVVQDLEPVSYSRIPLRERPMVTTRSALIDFEYMGSYNKNGVPDYLEAQRYNVSSDLLALVNASLPEGSEVPRRNPEYIANGVDADIKLRALCDVYITFVHEGAGYKNALGYYTYNLSNPPQSVDNINNLTIIFPNLSYGGSGGGMKSGDQVYLGRFNSNTGIGWFLIPDGYNSVTNLVEEGTKDQVKFSNKAFNTFTTAENRSHIVTLNDEARDLLLIGIEDIDRPGGDKDFNDAVFFVSANPYEAIIREDMAEVTQVPSDTDGDGVDDEFDQYPNDPTKAFDSYFPGKNTYGTLAFEDFWPRKGDYDMNDMVIEYNYQYQTSSGGNVTGIVASYRLEAMGAGYRNGFGIQLDVPPSAVSQVNGTQLFHSVVNLNGNGTEAGQNKAVIIPFDNGYQLMASPGGGFVNTVRGNPKINPAEIPVTISFASPQSKSALGIPPYNPFIFTDLTRGNEIHLPDQEPTDLVNTSLFGTFDDDSDSSSGRYYKTKNNLIWGINFPVPFRYPRETHSVMSCYPKFEEWAENNGAIYKDWYANPSSDYRITERLY